jgi:probable HAF family extracellular repeat protein
MEGFRMCRRLAWLLIAASGVGISSVPAWAQSLRWLGSLGTTYAEAYGVSADGSVVAGWVGVLNPHRAYRWTPAGGMVDLGSFGGSGGAEAYGLSADGSTVVGYSFVNSSIYRAFRWKNSEMHQIGTLGGNTSWAWATSADGEYVVGGAEYIDGRNRAFRWSSAGGLENLGTLPGGIRSVARAVSADGSAVAGWSGYGTGIHHAFRWAAGVMESIHNPAFGQSEALGISADGNTVVGAWGDASFTPARPFRWTAGTGMVDMGTLGGAWGEAWAASADGSIIVGWSERAQGDWRAFIWTPTHGLRDLNVLYAHLLSPGSELEDARGISPNGRFIVGRGINAQTGRNEAYLLDTLTCPGTGSGACSRADWNEDGVVDFNDFLAFLNDYNTASVCADLNGDGTVDFNDFLAYVNLFNAGC